MQTFSISIYLISMEKQVNNDAVLISVVFGTREQVGLRKVFWSKTF